MQQSAIIENHNIVSNGSNVQPTPRRGLTSATISPKALGATAQRSHSDTAVNWPTSEQGQPTSVDLAMPMSVHPEEDITRHTAPNKLDNRLATCSSGKSLIDSATQQGHGSELSRDSGKRLASSSSLHCAATSIWLILALGKDSPWLRNE